MGPKQPSAKGARLETVVVHTFSLAVRSDTGSSSAPVQIKVQIRRLAPSFDIVPVNAVSIGSRANASRVAGGRVSRVQTVHALVVMKRIRVTAAVIQQSL